MHAGQGVVLGVIDMSEFMVAAAVVMTVVVVVVVVCARRDSRRYAQMRVSTREYFARVHGTAGHVSGQVERQDDGSLGSLGSSSSVSRAVCESCRLRPATVTITVIDGSAVESASFRVCRDCGLLATRPSTERAAVIVLPHGRNDQQHRQVRGLVVTGERTGHETPVAH